MYATISLLPQFRTLAFPAVAVRLVGEVVNKEETWEYLVRLSLPETIHKGGPNLGNYWQDKVSKDEQFWEFQAGFQCTYACHCLSGPVRM